MAGNYNVSIRMETDSVRNSIRTLSSRVMNSAASQMELYAKTRVEPYMKSHAPWRDRTGNARRGLKATVKKEGTIVKKVTMELSHGVWYGYRLETWFNKRYEILWPTVRSLGPEMIATFNGLLSRTR